MTPADLYKISIYSGDSCSQHYRRIPKRIDKIDAVGSSNLDSSQFESKTGIRLYLREILNYSTDDRLKVSLSMCSAQKIYRRQDRQTLLAQLLS